MNHRLDSQGFERTSNVQHCTLNIEFDPPNSRIAAMSDTFEGPAPTLHTSRLKLRALALTDVPQIHAYASDPEVARYTLWPPHASLEFTSGFIQHFIAPAFRTWAITLEGSDAAVGMVFLHTLSRHHRKAEIAFNLAPDVQRKGYATEAARCALQHAFETLILNRIEATCMPENHACRRVLEKLGMTHEGRSRKSHSRHDGFHDMDLFAVLTAEFVAATAK